jgi:hypothetical protein
VAVVEDLSVTLVGSQGISHANVPSVVALKAAAAAAAVVVMAVVVVVVFATPVEFPGISLANAHPKEVVVVVAVDMAVTEVPLTVDMATGDTVDMATSSPGTVEVATEVATAAAAAVGVVSPATVTAAGNPVTLLVSALRLSLPVTTAVKLVISLVIVQKPLNSNRVMVAQAAAAAEPVVLVIPVGVLVT